MNIMILRILSGLMMLAAMNFATGAGSSVTTVSKVGLAMETKAEVKDVKAGKGSKAEAKADKAGKNVKTEAKDAKTGSKGAKGKKAKGKSSAETCASPAAKPAPLHAYDRFKKNVVNTTSGEFGKLHKNKKNQVFLELPITSLGSRFLIGATVSEVSHPASISIGYRFKKPICVTIEKQDSVIVIAKPDAGASIAEEEMAAALSRSYIPQTYMRIPVTALSKDSSSVVFDISALLKDFKPSSREVSISAKSYSHFGAMKVFSDNASVKMYDNVDINRTLSIFKVKTGEVTVGTTVSILKLPQDLMKPRVQDIRVGVFSTSGTNGKPKYELGTSTDGLKSYRLANRWRLEPADEKAWLEGKTVEVKQPIVWYVDNSFPSKWIPSIKKGILRWNAAFEFIGLKNVMQARDFPTPEEDPEFDPDNVKYNCIRYVPNATMNAMGPSWVDPVTGEILCASVLVYNDVIRLINNWRFIQTAQVDERVRTCKMPDDIVDESLAYVIAHEVGHTLGMMHNMAASASFPVDSLRSPSFTAIYGTTSSIMDYARFNYVAQPGDKGVHLTPPNLGIYDYYVIDWLYRPVPQAKNMWEEAEIASKTIEAVRGNKEFRYGAQQILDIYDPSCLSEDLGDDPVKAGNYGISNLKYILPNINEWLKEDEDWSLRQNMYSRFASQCYGYLTNVMWQVGGVYLNNYWQGADQPTVTPLDKKVQKQSLKWLIGQLRDLDWLDYRPLTSHFTLSTPMSNKLCALTAEKLATVIPSHVILSSSYAPGADKAYSITDYYGDLYAEVFKTSLAGKTLTSSEKTLQREIVRALAKPVNTMGKTKTKALAEDEMTELDFGQYSEEELREAMEPYQDKVNISSIDETEGCNTALLLKVKELSDRMRKTAPVADKAHYELLYQTARNSLDK